MLGTMVVGALRAAIGAKRGGRRERRCDLSLRRLRCASRSAWNSADHPAGIAAHGADPDTDAPHRSAAGLGGVRSVHRLLLLPEVLG